MLAQFVVIKNQKRNSAPEEPKEFTFSNATSIYIGRGNTNDIPLSDPGKTVSRNHARIVAFNGGYVLEDLESKNSTYVNNKNVEPGKIRILKSGDIITLGSFKITCYFGHDVSDQPADKPEQSEPALSESLQSEPMQSEPMQSKSPNQEVTQFMNYERSTVSSNPFAEVVGKLFENIQELCDIYDQEDQDDQQTLIDSLVDAIPANVPAKEDHIVVKVMCHFFNSLAFENREDIAEFSAGKSNSNSEYKHAKYLLNTLFPLLIKLLKIPHDFQDNFMASGSIDAKENIRSLLKTSPKKTVNQLLSSKTRTEVKKNMDLFKEATQYAVDHQTGMTEGYNAISKDIIQIVLREFDPSPLEEYAREMKPMGKVFPALNAQQVLNELRENVEQIQKTNWKVFEKRVFRPTYTKAYLSTIQPSPPSNGKPPAKNRMASRGFPKNGVSDA